MPYEFYPYFQRCPQTGRFLNPPHVYTTTTTTINPAKDRKKTINLSPAEILALPVTDDDNIETGTIGQYLGHILQAYWEQETFFDKGSPLGNPTWKIPIIRALDHAGVLEVERYTNDGIPLGYDKDRFKEVTDSAISLLTNADYSTLALPPEPKDWYVVKLARNNSSLITVVNNYVSGLTEEDAKTKAETLNGSANQKYWVAVHLPE